MAMAITAEQPARAERVGHLPLSGLSLLLALVLAVWEIHFFWGAGRNLFGLDGTLGLFTPDRLGFNIAWLTLGYLAFQLISIPFAVTYREQIFGVLDGLASVVPLLVSVVAIIGHPELLQTPACCRFFARPHELGGSRRRIRNYGRFEPPRHRFRRPTVVADGDGSRTLARPYQMD
jgi:hypothetical protein